MAAAHPAVAVLRPVGHEKQYARTGDAVGQQVEGRLRLLVQPVQILHHERQRLPLALADAQGLDGFERGAPTLHGGRCLPAAVLGGRHVQQCEQRRPVLGHLPDERLEHGLRLALELLRRVLIRGVDPRAEQLDDGSVGTAPTTGDGPGRQDRPGRRQLGTQELVQQP